MYDKQSNFIMKYRTYLSFALTVILIPQVLTARDLFLEGKKAFGAKKYKEARELFQQQLKNNPGNGDPYFFLGYMLEYQNEKEKAVEEYKRGVERKMSPELYEKTLWKIMLHYKYTQDWKNLEIYAVKYLKYRDSTQVKELKELAEEKIKKGTPEEQTLAESGKLKMKEGDLAGARTDFTNSLKIRRNYEPALWNLALIDIKEKKYTNAETVLEKLISEHPETWEYHYKAGIVYYNLKKNEKALEAFSRARSFNKETGDSFLHFINLSEGLTLMNMKERKKAKEKFATSLEYRSSAPVHGGLSRYYYFENDMENARSHANLALLKNENQIDALAVLSLIYYRESRYDSALTLFKKLLKGILEDVEAFEDDLSLQSFAAASAILPFRGYSKEAVSLYSYMEKQDLKIFFKKDDTLNIPDFDLPQRKKRSYTLDDYLFYAARAHFLTGDKKKALLIIGNDPERADAAYMAAEIHAELEDFEKAAEFLKTALKKDESLKTRAKIQPEFKKLFEIKPELEAIL